MYQYYVVEVRKTAAGELEHDVFWLYDEVEEKARLKGESKYHEVMSRAAVSTFAEHGAILFSSQCNPIKNGCYIHTPDPTT